MVKKKRPMQTAIEQILAAHGYLEAFQEARDEFHLKLEQPAYMPLVIEKLMGVGVSVAHYGSQAGDAIRDPELVFDGRDWHVVEITQDLVGIYRRLEEGEVSQGLEVLAKKWAKNLVNQGWHEPARVTVTSLTHPKEGGRGAG